MNTLDCTTANGFNETRMAPKPETIVQTQSLGEWYAERFLQPSAAAYLKSRDNMLASEIASPLAAQVGHISTQIGEIGDALHRDFPEKDYKKMGRVAAGGLAIGINIAGARSRIMPYELWCGQQCGVVAPAVVAGVSAAVHGAYYWLYGKAIIWSAEAAPETFQQIGKMLHADRIEIAGFDQEAEETAGSLRERARREKKRQQIGTLPCLAAITMKGLPVEKQKEYNNKALPEGMAGSAIKTAGISSVITAIAMADPALSSGIMRFLETFEGGTALTVAPLGYLAIKKAVKRSEPNGLSEDLLELADDAAADNEVTIIDDGGLSSSKPALLFQKLNPFISKPAIG